jgi:hypothetical protein
MAWNGPVRDQRTARATARPQRRRREEIASADALAENKKHAVDVRKADGWKWLGPRPADRKGDRPPAAPQARGNRERGCACGKQKTRGGRRGVLVAWS